MGAFEWAEGKTNAMTLWDVGALKVYCVLFGMIVGAYVPNFVTEHVWWFGVPVLVLGVVVGYRWFAGESG
jgi:putative Mn2+ efflux pump MntP